MATVPAHQATWDKVGLSMYHQRQDAPTIQEPQIIGYSAGANASPQGAALNLSKLSHSLRQLFANAAIAAIGAWRLVDRPVCAERLLLAAARSYSSVEKTKNRVVDQATVMSRTARDHHGRHGPSCVFLQTGTPPERCG